MKREDFVFTIGYQGDAAVVDGGARKRYGKLTSAELVNKGLYRAAFCAAIYDGTVSEFMEDFQSQTGIVLENETAAKRLFGVFDIPEQVEKTIVVG